MSKTWSTLRTGAAVLLAVAFCLGLVPSLLLGDVNAVLFDSERMTTLLTSTLVRSGALSTYAVRLLSEKVGGGNQVTSHLTQADWANLTRTLIPASWQEEQIVANLDGFYAWLDSSDPAPHWSVSLTGIKAGLQGDGGRRLADALVNSWPPCSTQQVQEYASGASAQGTLPICQPPEPYLGEVRQGLGQEVNQRAAQLPDNLALGNASVTAQAATGAEELKIALRLLRDFGAVAWLLPLLLLLLVLALAARSVRGLLGWTGVPLTIGALLGILLVLMLSVLRGRGLISLPGAPVALRASVVSFLGLLLRSVFGRLLIESAILLFVGFVLVVFSLVFGPRLKPASAVPAPDSAGNAPVRPAASAMIGRTEAGSQVRAAGPPAPQGSTVILPADSSSQESSGDKTPPRGIFG